MNSGRWRLVSPHLDRVLELTVDERPRYLTDLAGEDPALAAVEPEIAQVVDLKFFCGFTFAEIANLRGVTERTVQRQWDKARIYLRQALRAEILE